MSQKSLKALLFILILVVPACQIAKATPAPKIFFSLTSYPTSTPFPNLPATPTPSENGLPLFTPDEIITADIASEDFQDLIIFENTTSARSAFANFPLEIIWSEGTERHTYAFSPDGQRAGTLIPKEFASAIYLPADSTDKPKLVLYGAQLDHPEIQVAGLPQECYSSLTEGAKFLPCGRFQFSQDGEYVGFFFGPDACGRAIIIQDTKTGIQTYHSAETGGHYFVLPEEGKAVIGRGHCEGGGVTLYDLDSQGLIETPLGPEGAQTWNVNDRAFAVEISSYAGIDKGIWGFNLDTEKKFLELPDVFQIDNHPVWTPDPRYLLYQHRTYKRAEDGFTPTGFDSPRQILLVDAQTGEQKPLLSDPNYDFHLGSCSFCEEWYGDWIQVRRVAFSPTVLQGGEDMYSSEEYMCRMDAQSCSSPVELFGLNWASGELKPWNEIVAAGLIPTPSATASKPDPSWQLLFEQPGQYALYAGPDPNTFWVDWKYGGEGGTIVFSGPDLSSQPIYTHPDGLYSYFVGIDGNSLWMVPKEGIPLPWVMDGHHFFYLGKK